MYHFNSITNITSSPFVSSLPHVYILSNAVCVTFAHANNINLSHLRPVFSCSVCRAQPVTNQFMQGIVRRYQAEPPPSVRAHILFCKRTYMYSVLCAPYREPSRTKQDPISVPAPRNGSVFDFHLFQQIRCVCFFLISFCSSF